MPRPLPTVSVNKRPEVQTLSADYSRFRQSKQNNIAASNIHYPVISNVHAAIDPIWKKAAAGKTDRADPSAAAEIKREGRGVQEQFAITW